MTTTRSTIRSLGGVTLIKLIPITFVAFLFSHSHAVADEHTYINKTFGFAITKPKTWPFSQQSKLEIDRTTLNDEQFEELVSKFRDPLVCIGNRTKGNEEFTPYIEVSVRRRTLTIQTPIDVAKNLAESLTRSNSNLPPKYSVESAPTESEIAHIKGAFVSFDYDYYRGTVRYEYFIVPHGRIFLVIRSATRKDERSGTRKDSRAIVETLSLNLDPT